MLGFLGSTCFHLVWYSKRGLARQCSESDTKWQRIFHCASTLFLHVCALHWSRRWKRLTAADAFAALGVNSNQQVQLRWTATTQTNWILFWFLNGLKCLISTFTALIVRLAITRCKNNRSICPTVCNWGLYLNPQGLLQGGDSLEWDWVFDAQKDEAFRQGSTTVLAKTTLSQQEPQVFGRNRSMSYEWPLEWLAVFSRCAWKKRGGLSHKKKSRITVY